VPPLRGLPKATGYAGGLLLLQITIYHSANIYEYKKFTKISLGKIMWFF
jgi:hypothetical protein